MVFLFCMTTSSSPTGVTDNGIALNVPLVRPGHFAEELSQSSQADIVALDLRQLRIEEVKDEVVCKHAGGRSQVCGVEPFLECYVGVLSSHGRAPSISVEQFQNRRCHWNA